jgi:hypothetical protein
MGTPAPDSVKRLVDHFDLAAIQRSLKELTV